jgi:hypothetical protein
LKLSELLGRRQCSSAARDRIEAEAAAPSQVMRSPESDEQQAFLPDIRSAAALARRRSVVRGTSSPSAPESTAFALHRRCRDGVSQFVTHDYGSCRVVLVGLRGDCCFCLRRAVQIRARWGRPAAAPCAGIRYAPNPPNRQGDRHHMRAVATARSTPRLRGLIVVRHAPGCAHTPISGSDQPDHCL